VGGRKLKGGKHGREKRGTGGAFSRRLLRRQKNRHIICLLVVGEGAGRGKNELRKDMKEFLEKG